MGRVQEGEANNMNSKRKHSKFKRLVITTGALLLLAGSPIVQNNPMGQYLSSMTGTITAQAAETYSDNWIMDGQGTWHYYMSDGSMCTNAWVHDHGEWYLLDGAGNMLTGIVQSNGGKYYLLDNVRNTGTYGKLLKSGVYNGVQIQAEQSGDSEGALSQSTLNSLQAVGVQIVGVTNVANTKHVENGVVVLANQPAQSSGGQQTSGGTGTSSSNKLGENGWNPFSQSDLGKGGLDPEAAARGHMY